MPAQLRLAELAQCLALAADASFGLELEDGFRACYVATRAAEELGLSARDRSIAFYTALLKDAGCTCATTPLADLWDTDEIAARRDFLLLGSQVGLRDYAWFLRRHAGASLPLLARIHTIVRILAAGSGAYEELLLGTAEVCGRMVRRLGLPEDVEDAVRHMGAQWDGKGFPAGVPRARIPVAALLAYPTFFIVPFHRLWGRDAMRKVLTEGRGKAFSPEVTDTYLALMARNEFWEGLEDPQIGRTLLDMEPESEWKYAGASRLDDTALAFADFIDLKSPRAASHSRRVAGIARLAGCDAACTARIGRAALLHDIGLVTVPSHVINRPAGALAPSEVEQLRLHAYHGERLLERMPPFADLSAEAAAHHERFDGRGYFRGLAGHSIPFGARVIGVAARLDELTHADGVAAASLDDAIDVLRQEAGTAIDPAIVEALRASPPPPAPQPASWPAGLTTREVEVLRAAADGLKRTEIAGRLGITENTVRHHLEHIYNKTGTSTRVGAVLFAIEHNLIA